MKTKRIVIIAIFIMILALMLSGATSYKRSNIESDSQKLKSSPFAPQSTLMNSAVIGCQCSASTFLLMRPQSHPLTVSAKNAITPIALRFDKDTVKSVKVSVTSSASPYFEFMADNPLAQAAAASPVNYVDGLSDITFFDEKAEQIYIAGLRNPNTEVSYICTDEELFWLARIVEAEARGEPLNGKIAVANVVLNRAACPNFPNTICNVIFDTNGGIQFEPILNGSIYNSPSNESYLAAELALAGARPVEDCLFFASITDCWAARNRPYYGTIGHQHFYE